MKPMTDPDPQVRPAAEIESLIQRADNWLTADGKLSISESGEITHIFEGRRVMKLLRDALDAARPLWYPLSPDGRTEVDRLRANLNILRDAVKAADTCRSVLQQQLDEQSDQIIWFGKRCDWYQGERERLERENEALRKERDTPKFGYELEQQNYHDALEGWKAEVSEMRAQLTAERERADRAEHERDTNWETARQMANDRNFYQNIIRETGAIFGPEAYISDDGSIQDEVLALKVPELAALYVTSNRQLQAALRMLEWASGIDGTCPMCGNGPKHGHAVDCKLATLLPSPGRSSEGAT